MIIRQVMINRQTKANSGDSSMENALLAAYQKINTWSTTGIKMTILLVLIVVAFARPEMKLAPVRPAALRRCRRNRNTPHKYAGAIPAQPAHDRNKPPNRRSYRATSRPGRKSSISYPYQVLELQINSPKRAGAVFLPRKNGPYRPKYPKRSQRYE